MFEVDGFGGYICQNLFMNAVVAAVLAAVPTAPATMKRYFADLSDAQWTLVESLLPSSHHIVLLDRKGRRFIAAENK